MSRKNIDIQAIPEHIITKTELPLVKFINYFRFKDFYGGYLIYRLNNILYKQYLGWKSAQKIFNKQSPFEFQKI